VTSPAAVLVEAGRLAGQGKPYALATVVSVVRPASTRRGDRALVTPDGTLTGWVGGACSEPIVVREALRALHDGGPRLVRIGPPGTAGPDRPTGTGDPPDAVVAESSCASEGVVDVLIEPQLPAPLLAVVGDGPAGRTLAELARVIGWRVTREVTGGADAVVVATMGRGDEQACADALAGGAGYVGLVASARRAAVVLAGLRDRGLGEEALARLRSPAGRDLGSSSQEEIAVAILAELVDWHHQHPATGAEEPAELSDPVCGMTVALDAAAGTAEYAGVVYAFCSPACQAAFEADPARYLPA
jgi:xanthine dehydrogenase accessory factor